MPAGPHIFQHLEDALAESFEYHSQLDAFVLRAGLDRDRLAIARQRAESRKGRWESAPKRFVAQEILEEIRTGKRNDDRLVSQIVDGFCRGDFSAAKPAGLNAISALKKEREEDRQVAAEKRATQQREIEQSQRLKAKVAAEIAAVRDEFKQRFMRLPAITNAQQRGFALEKFLDEFFESEKLSSRGSFRIIGEQIDESFAWSGQTHLVEAKWTKEQVAGAEFGAFLYKIQGKTADTRGLFISISGYSKEAITGLNSKGELRFVCIDGAHLLRATEYGWSMKKLLEIVWRHAAETGEAYLPVSSARFIEKSM